MISPSFFNKKYMTDPFVFSGFVCERPHFSDIPVYAYIFSIRDFFRLLVHWVLNELTATSNKWVKKNNENTR